MEQTEQINELATALAKAQAEFPLIPRNKIARVRSAKANYTYTYADLADIFAAVRPALSKHGLSVSQIIDGDILQTWLMHTSGQRLIARIKLVFAGSSNMQESGIELTYRRRHSICAILGVMAEDDEDAPDAPEGSSESQPKSEVRAPQRRHPTNSGSSKSGEPASQGERKWLENRAGERIREILEAVGCESLVELTKDQFAAARGML